MLKKISTLNGFKKLSKGEQSEIDGGHHTGNFLCRVGCSLSLTLCFNGCPLLDTACIQNCEIEAQCCIDTCAPDGGQIR